MPYTRRSFVREAAVLSVGGVLGASAFALYKKRTQEKQIRNDTPLVATPYAGIRVVFAGSWLFCASANKPGWMYAMTLDMNKPSHHFPYGAWRNSGFDAPSGVLKPNPSPKNNPYSVNLQGYKMQPNTYKINDLFDATLAQVPFTYLPNLPSSGQLYTVDSTLPDIRIISLPIPIEIIPAGFLVGASVTPVSALGTTKPANPVNGVATTHIFNYPNAALMNFVDPDGTTVLDTAAKEDHFHFHTVPGRDSKHNGIAMFQNLQGLLKNVIPPLTLSSYDPTNMNDGPTVPLDVCAEELDKGVPLCTAANSHSPVIYNSRTDAASCAGGALGLGGDCGC